MKNAIIAILSLVVILLVASFFVASHDGSEKDHSQDAAMRENTATTSEMDVEVNAGVVERESGVSFASTTNAIRGMVAENEALTLMSEVDHAQNAENSGLQLASTTLFIFGNPNAGTPLMQESRSTALDLPQKMLVTQEEGRVLVRYNAPEYIAERHGITDQDERLETISGLLDMIAESANQ